MTVVVICVSVSVLDALCHIPGGQQSTIVLAQPGSAAHTVVTDVKSLQQGISAGGSQGRAGKAGGPVYARLIQPPAGQQIRLATVRAASPAAAAGSAGTTVRLATGSQVAGLNVIQTQRVQTPEGVQIITTAEAPKGQTTAAVPTTEGTQVVGTTSGSLLPDGDED